MTASSDPFGFVKRLAAKGDISWMADGACVDEDPDLFFPDPGANRPPARARKLCEGCPVRDRCLSYAVENKQFGVWGGTTEKQREVIRTVRANNRRRVIEQARAARGAA